VEPTSHGNSMKLKGGDDELDSLIPYIPLHFNTITESPGFFDRKKGWIMANVTLVNQEENLYLLLRKWRSGFDGTADESEEAIYLGRAAQSEFANMQETINKTFRGKYKRLRFNIAEVNKSNRDKNVHFLHCIKPAMFQGKNVTSHFQWKYNSEEEALQEKISREKSGYKCMYKKSLYIE
jgi:hypothetical protein